MSGSDTDPTPVGGRDAGPHVLIVGAGMAGLTAARRLRQLGVASTIVDKGRRPGGRMATRVIDGARFDHGAQHFSVRTPTGRAVCPTATFRPRADRLRGLPTTSRRESRRFLR